VRIALEREHAAAEVAHAGGEPDRRVPAAGADLEHLAVGLGRDQGEEELPRRSFDGNGWRSNLLGLEPREHRADAVVQHQVTSTLIIPSSTRTGKVSTGWYAGRVSGRPERMSKFAPCLGQMTTPDSGSKSPSQSGPSSCEQRSSIA